MWQLEMAATKASSGSTAAGFEYGGQTTDGDGDAWMVTPPSNDHVCYANLPVHEIAAVALPPDRRLVVRHRQAIVSRAPANRACRRLQTPLGGHHILALDKAAGVLPRRNVRERNIVLQSAKERDPGPDRYRNAGDDEPLNESSP